jgi:hypothetical protein
MLAVPTHDGEIERVHHGHQGLRHELEQLLQKYEPSGLRSMMGAMLARFSSLHFGQASGSVAAFQLLTLTGSLQS